MRINQEAGNSEEELIWKGYAFWQCIIYDDVIKWKPFPRYSPFMWEIHRSPVNFPRKGQWREALICAWTNVWANYQDAGHLRCHWAHYDSPTFAQQSWHRNVQIAHASALPSMKWLKTKWDSLFDNKLQWELATSPETIRLSCVRPFCFCEVGSRAQPCHNMNARS